VVRTIRVRDVDEQSLSMRPVQRVQHEAVVTMMALQTGARVPVVHAVVPAARDSAIIALDVPPGRALAEISGDEVSDAALDDLWHQLGRLHRGRIAHRSLTLPNLVLDGDSAWLTGLENARLVAGEEPRALDVAELLVSTTLVVGVERAIEAAVRSADHDELVASLAFIQPPALPPQTRKAAKKPKGLITDIRTGLQAALGVEAVELAELDRISIPKLLTWVGFVVLAYFLLSLASSWSEIADAMAGLNWWWVVPILAVTLIGPVAGAVSMMGSVLRPLPLGDTTIIMFGQSFLNRFTPMNAGGMAMRIRYLQKGGTDGTVATAAIGLTSAASGVMQVLFIAFFLLWSSTDPTDDTQGADAGSSSSGVGGTVVVVVAIAVVLALLVFAFTPKLRRWLINFVKSTISKIRHDFGELARQPTKLLMLFGGAGAGKMLTIIAFVLSCRAFHIDLSFAELGALYMIANTVASTVPTPGGVGAIDAALVLVLTNAGVDQGTAWAATLLFRTINYWFPTIPGFLGLKLSERRELI
jgi:glycosyltransferase 2 family protein